MKFLKFLWKNRTRTFASLQGLIAVLAGLTNVFEPDQIKWLLVVNALLTYALGQFNKWQQDRA